MAECEEGWEIGGTDDAGGGGAGGRDSVPGGFAGNYYNFDGGTGFGGGASFSGESVGIVYHCADDAIGVGDGARNAGGRWSENILGDGFWGVGFVGVCMGGEVGGGGADVGQDVYVGSTDVGLVDHGVWSDGEYSADLAALGPARLPQFILKNRNGSGAGGTGGDFSSAVADASGDSVY